MTAIVVSTTPGTEKFRFHLSTYETVEDEQALLDEGGDDDKIVAFIELNCSDPRIRAIEAILELDNDTRSPQSMDLFQEIFMAGRSSVKK